MKSIYVLTIGHGINVGSHSVLCVGYDQDKKQFKFLNSYGTAYGENGCFYIKYTDWFNLGPYGYISYDVADINPALLAYEGKDVKSDGDPRIFRITDGKRRWFPTEKSFFFHGGKFSPPSYVRIANSLLKVIPDGANMEEDIKFRPESL